MPSVPQDPDIEKKIKWMLGHPGTQMPGAMQSISTGKDQPMLSLDAGGHEAVLKL